MHAFRGARWLALGALLHCSGSQATDAAVADGGASAPSDPAGPAINGGDGGAGPGSTDSGASGATSDAGGASDAGASNPARELVMCLTGATTRADSSNQAFNVLCDGPEVRGVLQSCDSSGCYNTWNAFLVDPKTNYASLFAALDTNKDGKVDAADTRTHLSLLGFSWGGLQAVQIAALFLADANVAPASRVLARLVVMDPYQPGGALQVPAGVASYVELRHSVAPSTDCSSSAPLGPYLGIAPHCAAGQDCRDYDYSLAPTTAFPTDTGGTMKGGAVGHCDVPLVAGPIVRALFAGKTPSAWPPSVAVAP